MIIFPKYNGKKSKLYEIIMFFQDPDQIHMLDSRKLENLLVDSKIMKPKKQIQL